MGRYHQARQQLKATVEQTLRADLTPTDDESILQRQREMVDSRSEQLLDNFEAMVVAQIPRPDGFMRGVWQSAVGSALFVVVGGFFLYGYKQDWLGSFLNWLGHH